MFALELREFDWAESVGSVSKRYISMKPNIRDNPIQTCGGRDDGGSEDTLCLSSPLEVEDPGPRWLVSSSVVWA